MLNIDKLRYTYENHFLDLMDGMERKVHPDYPHRTIWYKEDGWYFEQDEKMVIFGVNTIEFGHF